MEKFGSGIRYKHHESATLVRGGGAFVALNCFEFLQVHYGLGLSFLFSLGLFFVSKFVLLLQR
jgi:hypothetical protein